MASVDFTKPTISSDRDMYDLVSKVAMQEFIEKSSVKTFSIMRASDGNLYTANADDSAMFSDPKNGDPLAIFQKLTRIISLHLKAQQIGYANIIRGIDIASIPNLPEDWQNNADFANSLYDMIHGSSADAPFVRERLEICVESTEGQIYSYADIIQKNGNWAELSDAVVLEGPPYGDQYSDADVIPLIYSTVISPDSIRNDPAFITMNDEVIENLNIKPKKFSFKPHKHSFVTRH